MSHAVPDHMSKDKYPTITPLVYGKLRCNNCGCLLGRHDNITDGMCDTCIDELDND